MIYASLTNTKQICWQELPSRHNASVEETVQNLGGLILACGTKGGPIARRWRRLGQGWPVLIRRTPRFWTVSQLIAEKGRMAWQKATGYGRRNAAEMVCSQSINSA